MLCLVRVFSNMTLSGNMSVIICQKRFKVHVCILMIVNIDVTINNLIFPRPEFGMITDKSDRWNLHVKGINQVPSLPIPSKCVSVRKMEHFWWSRRHLKNGRTWLIFLFSLDGCQTKWSARSPAGVVGSKQCLSITIIRVLYPDSSRGDGHWLSLVNDSKFFVYSIVIQTMGSDVNFSGPRPYGMTGIFGNNVCWMFVRMESWIFAVFI